MKRLERERLDADVVSCLYAGFPEGASPLTARDRDPLETGCTVAVCTYQRAASLRLFLDSLADQHIKPAALVIVDASPNDETEQIVADYPRLAELAERISYFRVTGALKGLTKQRNYALRHVTTQLVAFFDDDVVLLQDALHEMIAAHQTLGNEVVGVGAIAQNQIYRPTLLWRLRRLFWIVPHLDPGRYTRSGMATPWAFQQPSDDLIDGDWLSGCAMMWKSSLARQIGFNPEFAGYSNGEDLDFGLKMGRHGRVVVAGKARILHLVAEAGRPNCFLMGYAGMRNAHWIHRNLVARRTWRDAAWFVYAYSADTLIRALALVRPGQVIRRAQFLQGRLRFFVELPWVK